MNIFFSLVFQFRIIIVSIIFNSKKEALCKCKAEKKLLFYPDMLSHFSPAPVNTDRAVRIH